jgi:hypothetical protein
MKRSLSIILAAAAILACTKTEVNYDMAQQSEIALTPVSGVMTKAAVKDGKFPVRNHIGLYAYYTPEVEAGIVADYSKFATQFFNNTEFHCEVNAETWDGFESDYYWPATGSLVFAGYSLNDPEKVNLPSKQNGTPSYDLATDELKITGYAQSNITSSTYDLLYFGRTAESYSKNATSVPVQFHHALSWIEIQVKGSTGSLMGGNRTWRVTKVMFDEVDTKGDFTYTGTSSQKVKWDSNSPKDIVIYSGDQPLTDSYKVIENVDAGTLVIPQAADKLYATIEYASPAGDPIKEVVEIDITAQTPTWEPGKKYTYQLTFSPQEILVAPSVDTWPGTGEVGNVNTTWPANN